MLSFRRMLFLALGLFLSVQATAASRTWHFNLKTPGTYELHVQHDYQAASIPRGAEISYSFQTKEKTTKRDMPFYPNSDGHPYIELIVDVPSPQTVNVVLSGIPQPFLEKAQVYVIDINTRYPYEWLEPEKTVELPAAQQLRNILKLPEPQIDLARAKLIIDQQIDYSIDIEATLKKIEDMVNKIRTMPEFGPSSTAKLLALKRYLYEPGIWNDYQTYQYDLDDPLGTKITNKLLPTYLSSKKGNCVSMPALFIILGQRLGIHVTAATAPLHILVKFTDDQGMTYNLEATNGANPTREVWYRQQMPMTDQSIANGVYLKPLTQKETIALMVETLTEHYLDQHEYEKTITLSDLILEHYPQDVTVMIRKSNAYYDLLHKYYVQKYSSPNDIPERARGHYLYLVQNNRQWAEKAQVLGWREPTKEEDEKYLQRIKEAKAKQ